MDDAISRNLVLKEVDGAIDLATDDEMHHALCTLGERFLAVMFFVLIFIGGGIPWEVA